MANHRTELGADFSEGARLLWVAAEDRAWSQRRLGRELGAYEGEIMGVLYGDKRPRLEIVVAAERMLDVPSGAWLSKPLKAFVAPAARAQKQPARGAA